MPEIKLKPCPFCGRLATTRIAVVRGTAADRIRFSACCPACRIELHTDIENYDSFEEAEKAAKRAIEAWNRRAENDTD